MQNLLTNIQNESQVEKITGGMDLLAANYYHPNGHTMPFLIGLEYATYRWMRLANDDAFEDEPTECAICKTDFTTSWVKIDGNIVCEKCAKKNVKKEAHVVQKRKMRESLMKTFMQAHQKVSSEYEAKQEKRRRIEELHRKIQEKENNPKLENQKVGVEMELDEPVKSPAAKKSEDSDKTQTATEVTTEPQSKTLPDSDSGNKISQDEEKSKDSVIPNSPQNSDLTEKNPVQEPEVSEIGTENEPEPMETESEKNGLEKSNDSGKSGDDEKLDQVGILDQIEKEDQVEKVNEVEKIDEPSKVLNEQQISSDSEKGLENETEQSRDAEKSSEPNEDPSSIIDSILGDDFSL